MNINRLAATKTQSGFRWVRYGYLGVAWIVVLSIMIQVFLAGINVFLRPLWWGQHINFGHIIGAMIVVQLGIALGVQLPSRIRWLSAGMLLLFGLQYNHRVLAGLLGVPQLAAIHAVNALVLFWCATTLARWAWQAVQKTEG